MSRVTSRKPAPHPENHGGKGVVRAMKPIPVMHKAETSKEESAAGGRALVCSGRCGHCDVHPCQLHVTI